MPLSMLERIALLISCPYCEQWHGEAHSLAYQERGDALRLLRLDPVADGNPVSSPRACSRSSCRVNPFKTVEGFR